MLHVVTFHPSELLSWMHVAEILLPLLKLCLPVLLDAGWMLKTAITASAGETPASCCPKAHLCFHVSARNKFQHRKKKYGLPHLF